MKYCMYKQVIIVGISIFTKVGIYIPYVIVIKNRRLHAIIALCFHVVDRVLNLIITQSTHI